MSKLNISFYILISVFLGTQQVHSQIDSKENTTASTSDYIIIHPTADRTVYFDISDQGEYKPIIWGLDLAWLSRENIIRGIAFMAAENVNIIRSSFTPTAPLLNGELQNTEMRRLNERLNIIDMLPPETQIVLNCDHPSVDPWFIGNAERWAQLIDITTQHHEERGRTVISVSPFNEPDYGWGQGTIEDFYNIAGELRSNPRFENIRISGGNTLDADKALTWYNFLKGRLDEGNTHQLAGSFASYAAFFESVRANGHHATNDELHNVMEAMVGVEYGMQTGIWWGTAELARGEFVKASHGERLGYAEHRQNWTAASVYRNPEGKVQAFGGTSERQAATTTYNFYSYDRDVFYDGHGPQRKYTMTLPGGTGYQQGQSNAERMVNITWGDDVQPVIDGKYLLVNRNSGKIIEVENGVYAPGGKLIQNNYEGRNYQQWKVTPVNPRIGGDFSYFTISAVHSEKAMDVNNWDLNNNANIIAWDDTKGSNQQWFLEYIEDGWFYIRSRHSAKCLDIYESATNEGAKIIQYEKNNSYSQHWRFLPINAEVEFEAPNAPAGLNAEANNQSILLQWSKNLESDIADYTIYRSETSGGPYHVIGRNVVQTAFVDNTINEGQKYYYVIRAFDHSFNRSEYSNEVSALANGEKNLILHFAFNDNILDSSSNLFNSVHSDEAEYTEGINNSKALKLNGNNSFLKLSPYLTKHEEISLACWVNWNGGTSSQRIFEFSNEDNQEIFLIPGVHFVIKDKDKELILSAPRLTVGEWTHLAVTISSSQVCLYVNGILVDEAANIFNLPFNFKAVSNYIGKSRSPSIKLFNGAIDDFKIYNYAVPTDTIVKLNELITNIEKSTMGTTQKEFNVYPLPAKDMLYIDFKTKEYAEAVIEIYNANGSSVKIKNVNEKENVIISVADLKPGVYILKLCNKNETISRKIIINK